MQDLEGSALWVGDGSMLIWPKKEVRWTLNYENKTLKKSVELKSRF